MTDRATEFSSQFTQNSSKSISKKRKSRKHISVQDFDTDEFLNCINENIINVTFSKSNLFLFDRNLYRVVTSDLSMKKRKKLYSFDFIVKETLMKDRINCEKSMFTKKNEKNYYVVICEVIQLHEQKETNADLKYVKSDNATIKAMFRSRIERLSKYFKTFEENSSDKSAEKSKKQKIQKQKENFDNTQNCMKKKIDSDLYDYDKELKKIFSNEIITEKRHVDTDISIKLLKHARKFNNAFEQSMK